VSANLDLVRSIFADWERGSDITEAFDPKVEFTRTGGGSDVLGYPTESRGIDGLWAALGAWTDEWSDVQAEAESFVEVEKRVLVLVRHRGVGKRSGVKMDHVDGWVFSISEGRIVRWDAYWNPDDAKRAVGLEK
jgi:ketosteroid isomerase-like protein